MKAQTNFVQRQIDPTVLTVEEAMNRQKEFLIIDVQNPKYVTSIIPRAQRLNEAILLKDIPKKAVLVTCFSGERSFRVAQKLIQRGYCDVYVLKGGVMAWQRAGYMTQLMKLPT